MKQPATRGTSRMQRGGSRDAIVSAAEELFLERGYGAVSMDDLAEQAGVARRTLYNQFASKEEILREMLERVSRQMGSALPPGIETQGDAEQVLGLIARGVLAFQASPEHVGLIRMTVADARQYPWIAASFDSLRKPYLERFVRYLSHLTALDQLDCPDPLLAAHQFLGLLNEPILWPRVLGQECPPISQETVIEEAVRIFMLRYGVNRPAASTR